MTSRWVSRLAPPLSELPLKTYLATAVATLAALAGFGVIPEAPLVTAPAFVAGLFIVAPLTLVAFARRRHYAVAERVTRLLYWRSTGRAGLHRLLAQVALQQGDAEVALRLIPQGDGNLVRMQALALQGRWQELLALSPPEGGDNAFLAQAARIQAMLELGHLDEADDAFGAMQRRWREQGEGPLGYRSITLTQARVYAARGDFQATHKQLQEPLENVPPYLLMGILAEAAERSGNTPTAVTLYGRAYALAPASRREGFAEKLHAYNQETPAVSEVRPRRPVAALVLMGVILAAYGVQMLFERRYGPLMPSLVGGFLLNFPAVPEATSSWRYLSYAFVHGGLFHVAMNSWVLYDLGRLYEARKPWGNLLTAFVFGTVLGSYLTSVAQAGEQLRLVGASGGVLGIGGALLADVLRSRAPQDRLLLRALLQWIVLIGLISFIPGVSLWGHVGGLVGGLLWGFMRQGLPGDSRVDTLAGGVGVALLLYALVRAGWWSVQYAPLF